MRVGGQTAVNEGGTYQWRPTSGLRVGTRIPKLLDEWETESSYSAGYLAGIYDGEGCYYTRKTTGGYAAQLSFSQKEGMVLAQTLSMLGEMDIIGLSHQADGRDVTSVRLQGGTREIVKMLGTVRPVRLLGKFKPEHIGSLNTKENPSVVSIEPLGVMDIVRIDIDAKTMIVEGFPHHNCYLHEEDYKGPQGNTHWRGIIIKHEVAGGEYDPMFVSLDYLCRRYEGISLDRFMGDG